MPVRKVQKKQKFSISLSPKEREMLTLYAEDQGISRPAALLRMVKRQLREYAHSRGEIAPANQLDIFDSVQIDIFNNTSKTS